MRGMIVASVDPTSQAFAVGEVIGVMAAAATAVALLWWLSRSWRAQSTPPGGDPALALREKRRRNGFIAGVTVLIVAVASVKAAASYHPEPRAVEALSADGTEESLVIILPEIFDRFRLLTGEDAQRAETEVLAGRKLPHSMRTGYYDQDADGSYDLFVLVNSADWDPKVAENKATKSIAQELRGLFNSSNARGVTPSTRASTAAASAAASWPAPTATRHSARGATPSTSSEYACGQPTSQTPPAPPSHCATRPPADLPAPVGPRRADRPPGGALGLGPQLSCEGAGVLRPDGGFGAALLGVPDDESAVGERAAGALPGGRHQVRPPRSSTSAPRRPPVVVHSRRPHHALDCDRSKTWRSSGGRTR